MSDGYKEFLQAVVNADERKGGWRRDDFRLKYRIFFPINDSKMLVQQQYEYEETRRRWKSSLGEVPIEQYDSEYGYHVAILRHRLRVIWMIAASGDIAAAQGKLPQLYTDAHRYLRVTGEDSAFEPWRLELKKACSTELNRYLDKLSLCDNPRCQNRYFIRHGRQQYCSIPCSTEAKAIRQRGRNKKRAGPPKNVNKSKGALTRWERERDKQRNEK
jgi:hypothetical protein